MPRRKKRKAAAKPVTVTFRTEVTESTASYYCNLIAVNHTAFEFVLNMLKPPATLTAEQLDLARKGKPVPVEALLQVTIPSKLMPSFIKALQTQKGLYEASFGPLEKKGK